MAPPDLPDSPWTGWINASVYDAFVARHGIYRELNRWLAELAELAGARRVLDLGCGAGATAEACLAVLPRSAELVGVDASRAMVELARSRILDPRARFVTAPAAAAADALADLVGAPAERFDRAVSNAAFWQFPSARPVLAALTRMLEPGALFVFNVPAERVAGEEPPAAHPFQVALAREVERASGRPFPRTPTRLDPGELDRKLAETGFGPAARHRRLYRGRQRELMELMEIPAMIEPLTPGLDAERRHEVLARAGRRVDPEQEVAVPWIYFVARREDGRLSGPSSPGRGRR